jgi:hypothetical protein
LGVHGGGRALLVSEDLFACFCVVAQRCGDLKETAEVIAKVGFKMFLGVTAQVVGFDAVRSLLPRQAL